MIAALLVALLLAAQADGRPIGAAPPSPPASEARPDGPPTLRVDVPAAFGRVGDALAVTLTVEGAPEGAQFAFPDPLSPFGDLTVASWTGESATRTYRLRSFVPGDHLVPKLRVTVHPPGAEAAPVVLESEEVVLSFDGLVPDDATDIRPEKGGVPVAAPIPWAWIGAGAAGLAAAAFLVARSRRPKRKAEAPAAPPVPPDVAALRALDELQRSGLAARGEVKEHFYRLSSILRTYIEARFGVAAPDMTSEEFLEATASSSVLPASHRDSLREFMRVADLAKYARFEPERAEIESTLEAARRFVLDTPLVSAPESAAAMAS